MIYFFGPNHEFDDYLDALAYMAASGVKACMVIDEEPPEGGHDDSTILKSLGIKWTVAHKPRKSKGDRKSDRNTR